MKMLIKSRGLVPGRTRVVLLEASFWPILKPTRGVAARTTVIDGMNLVSFAFIKSIDLGFSCPGVALN